MKPPTVRLTPKFKMLILVVTFNLINEATSALPNVTPNITITKCSSETKSRGCFAIFTIATIKHIELVIIIAITQTKRTIFIDKSPITLYS